MAYVPRFTVAGVDTSAPSHAKLPNRGNQGSPCYDDALQSQHIYDSPAGGWLPVDYVPFEYDVATHGGGIGDHTLGVSVPANIIILDGVIDVLDSFVSGGGGTVALTVEGAADVLPATNAAGLAAGLLDTTPDGTAANAIKTTVERTITATVASAAFTAGKLRGFLRCLRTAATIAVVTTGSPTTAAPTTAAPTTAAPTTAAPTTGSPTTAAPTTAAPTTPGG